MGTDAIIINYDFTNNSADPTAALWALDLTSFQGGVALEPAYSVEGCNSDPYYTTEVKGRCNHFPPIRLSSARSLNAC